MNRALSVVVALGLLVDPESRPSLLRLTWNGNFPARSDSLDEAAPVTLTVYDLLGRQVAELVNTQQSSGDYVVPFEADILAAGAYLVRLRVGNQVAVRTIMRGR